jgi:hypothetical protein
MTIKIINNDKVVMIKISLINLIIIYLSISHTIARFPRKIKKKKHLNKMKNK